MRAAQTMRKAIKDIVCAYAYPRLDMEVSKKMNHLLKVGRGSSCRRAGTGRCCGGCNGFSLLRLGPPSASRNAVH